MLSAYPACFFKESNGYSVIFPDLNYTATCGSNLSEALDMAVECLAGYLYTCKMEGEIYPTPSDINTISPNTIKHECGFESDEFFINMVTVDVDIYAKMHFNKSVKKTLTIPAWLNAAALKKNINFSQVLQEALKLKLRNNK